MRSALAFVVLVALAAPAAAQVQIDAHLENARYLAGEPVVVIVDLHNLGDRPVAYLRGCNSDVRLEVAGAQRRTLQKIFGCSAGIGAGFACGFGGDAPRLLPGQQVSSRYLLKDYDLETGQYSLTVSGRLADTAFERVLSLNVDASTEDELQQVFAPLVAVANGSDLVRKFEARAAIIEAAPQFLDTLIARFAAENLSDRAAIEALGRLGTTASRTQLKALFRLDPRRDAILLALARIGHPDDTEFLSGLLQESYSDGSRSYAALGLGRIGTDRAVADLDRALPVAPPELRRSIATALGNSRSRRAIPVLIGMYDSNSSREVCDALETMTHLKWCDGSTGDTASTRRRWLRLWNEISATAQLFGPDECPPEPVAPVAAENVVEIIRFTGWPRATGVPRITSLSPTAAAPNTHFEIWGHALGIDDTRSVKLLFSRDGVDVAAAMGSYGGANSPTDPELQIIHSVVPDAVTPGRWDLVVENSVGRSAPMAIEIIAPYDAVITGVSPARPHPAQFVTIETAMPARADHDVELVDARGVRWRIRALGVFRTVMFQMPDDIAEGEATFRVGALVDGVDRFSAPLRFIVTSTPSPLKTSAVTDMSPVAPGQWTDFAVDLETEFELVRADRVELEFRQGRVRVFAAATGSYHRHVPIPARLRPGSVMVRTRTWIDRTASAWSAPAAVRVLARPVPTFVSSIYAGPTNILVWSSGDAAPAFVPAPPGVSLRMSGQFPVGRAADLRVQLRGQGETLELSPVDIYEEVGVEMPGTISAGDWRLIIGPRDGRTPMQEVTTFRVK